MPLKHKKPPQASLAALDVAEKAARGRGRVKDAVKKVKKDHGKHHPHPILVVDLVDLAGDAGLSKARQVGWRYLAEASKDDDYSLEVDVDSKGKKHSFGMVNKGPFVAATRKTLKDLGLKKEVKKGNYSYSMLRIPALFLVALWLQNEDEKGKDLIVPMEPSPDYLKAGQTYTPEEFHAAVRAPAQAILGAEASAEPAGAPTSAAPLRDEEDGEDFQTDDSPVSPPEE